MAHRRQSIKKIRIDKKRREYNVRVLSALRTTVRKVDSLIAAKNGAEIKTEASHLFSALDKAVKKGLLKKNQASRRKSRIQLKINLLKLK